MALPVIRSLVPVKAEEEHDLLLASRFRDDEEEGSVITDTGDKNPCTELVYAEYMVVPCPKY